MKAKLPFSSKEFKKRWRSLSLMEQLAHIGSELSRARRWQGKNKEYFLSAAVRTLFLFDLTIEDLRWRRRLKEILRLRYLFCDAVWGKNEFKTSLADLERLSDQFAFAARNRGFSSAHSPA